MSLLDRVRRVNALLQKTAGQPVNFNEMAKTLSEVINGNVFILSRRGKVLGGAVSQEIENERMKSILEDSQFPEEYTAALFNIFQTTDNIEVDSLYSDYSSDNCTI